MQQLALRYKWYTWTLIAGMVLLVIFFAMAAYRQPILVIAGHPLGDYVFWAAGIILIWHLYLLGKLASSIGRSPGMWIFGAFFFAPLGMLIAYARMAPLVRTKLNTTTEAT
jgi:hypothetical protein